MSYPPTQALMPATGTILCATGQPITPANKTCLAQLGDEEDTFQVAERGFLANRYNQDMRILGIVSGTASPMVKLMERSVASKVGRLTCLPSSHHMDEILTGRVREMSFEDFGNRAEYNVKLTNPQIEIEKSMGIRLDITNWKH
ncbi:uncharacterized protein LOC115625661 [Scaptodrosophila lebanonensis]|uniref:Uncharacterized protein LOC115625661 n=1 Tax=Drosophila lebanonensis TaxID=7225 RepID=A0A6J2TNU8_DROLE|nr:uncharacterized protein LOC115625661 [Scaptodrosophila lebanonensis]